MKINKPVLKTSKLQLDDITIEVEQKNIKNIYLYVYPPVGRVRIAAPMRMSLNAIRDYAISKLKWIKKQQAKHPNQEREITQEFINQESYYFLGKRYLLQVVEVEAKPGIELKDSTLILYIRPGTPEDRRQAIIENWYRSQLKLMLPEIIAKWEKQLKVNVSEFGIKKMKTKWGTCNIQARRIWLNLELAKKPPQCLEYIVVHEMIHLLECKHNARFKSLMDEHLPDWRLYKEDLNRSPI